MFFIVLSLLSPVRAQFPADSAVILFDVNDMFYHSRFEYKVFDEFEDGEQDYLSLFAALNPGTTGREAELYRDWIDQIVAAINDDRFGRIRKERKIRDVTAYVRKALLINYREKTTFDDLFRFGDYNYLTAACIYALILEQLQIPYVIKETASHIYLLAYPGTDNIVVETIIPEFRYFMFDHRTRSGFVEYLIEHKLVDEAFIRSHTRNEIYEKYFFPQRDLSLRELAGLQYMHQAIENVQQELYKNAYQNMQKAYYLYPSFKMRYMLLAQFYTFLETMDFSTTEQLVYLAISPAYIPIGFDPDYFMNRFSRLTKTYLIDQGNVNEYNRIYRYLHEEVENGLIRDQISFLYYYETGRHHFNSGKYERSLDQLERAFTYSPNNLNLHNLFVRTLAAYATTTGAANLVPRVEMYDGEFPAIDSSEIFIMVKLHAFLQYAGESFQVEDGRSGADYLEKFEQLHQEHPAISVDHYLIGRSYSSAAIYYYKKGQVKRSRDLVEKGLELAPDNVELRLKLDAFRE